LLFSTELATEVQFGIDPGLPRQSAVSLGAERSLHAADRGGAQKSCLQTFRTDTPHCFCHYGELFYHLISD